MELLRTYAGFLLSTKLEPKDVQIVKTYVIMEKYIGWGLNFVQCGAYIQLVSLTPGSFAQQTAILQPGDVLFKVEKAKMLGYRLKHMSSMVNAIKTGTIILVTVYRNFITLLGQCTTNTTAAVAARDNDHATRACTCPRSRQTHDSLVKVSPRKLSRQTIGPSAHSNVALHRKTCVGHNKEEQFEKDSQEQQQPHQQKQKKTIQLQFMRIGHERTVEIDIPEPMAGSTECTCLGQEVEKEAVTVQSRKKEVLSE